MLSFFFPLCLFICNVAFISLFVFYLKIHEHIIYIQKFSQIYSSTKSKKTFVDSENIISKLVGLCLRNEEGTKGMASMKVKNTERETNSEFLLNKCQCKKKYTHKVKWMAPNNLHFTHCMCVCVSLSVCVWILRLEEELKEQIDAMISVYLDKLIFMERQLLVSTERYRKKTNEKQSTGANK